MLVGCKNVQLELHDDFRNWLHIKCDDFRNWLRIN